MTATAHTRVAIIIVTILYGVTEKWTLPSGKSEIAFQSVVMIVFKFSSLTIARNRKSSETAEKQKNSDLSLARIRFQCLLNCDI